MTATIENATNGTVTVAEAEPMTISASREGRPQEVTLLGYEVNWSVQGIQITRGTLVDLLTECGFKQHTPKRPPTAKQALRRAIVEWGGNRAGTAFADDEDNSDINRRKKLVREIKGKAERGMAAPITIALVEEASLGEQLGLKYATAYRFMYQPSSPDEVGGNDGTLRVSTTGLGSFDQGLYEETRQVEAEIMPLWEKHKNLYSGADLSPILIDIVHEARGISVQSGTGVWFVPAAESTLVDNMERLMAGLAKARIGGREPYLRIRENIDWPRTRQALADAAMDEILSEIEQASSKLDRFEEQNRDKPGSVQIKTMAGIMSQFTALQEKAAFYADTMGMRTARINTGLTAISDRAVGIARQTRAARNGAAPAPIMVAPEASNRQSRMGRS